MSDLGVVAIGRNEGERLRRCLVSLAEQAPGSPIVYVDSGSTDGSVAMARGLGVDVVELDLSIPFTAARARNEGFARLEQSDTHRYVQFIDGDCEVAPGWLDRARAELDSRPDVVAVCGRRRERFPDQSVYNRLIDMEWDTPVGEADACGGDVLVRADTFRQIGGYNPGMIAGEDPEMCIRLRKAAGGKILRIDAEMTLHDAALTQLGQWWKRLVRAGHAYAESAAMYGYRHDLHTTRQIVLYGIINTLLVLILAWPAWPLSLLLAMLFPLKIAIATIREIKAGRPPRLALIHSTGVVMAILPMGVGFWMYWSHRIQGRASTLIEYKNPVNAAV
ncbi:glycosyltransferase family A protein [Isosphaeraceae bacterium EP7]